MDDYEDGENTSLVKPTEPESLGVKGLLSPNSLVANLFDHTMFHVHRWYKLFLLGVLIVQFLLILILGLTITENIIVPTGKQVLLSDQPVCLAEKAAHPGADSSFRCPTDVSVGDLRVLWLLFVWAVWLAVLMLWLAWDWGYFLTKRFPNLKISNMRVVEAVQKLKTFWLYPSTHHYLSMQLQDTEEWIWKIRTWGICDMTWFMTLTMILGQQNVYVIIFSGLIGFAYSATGYMAEIRRRMLAQHGHSVEMGLIRNFMAPACHYGILIVMIFCWGFQYGDLHKYSNAPAYALTIFLIYVIFLFCGDAFTLVHLIASRIFFKGQRDQHILRPDVRGAIWILAFSVFFGGLLSYLTLFMSMNDQMLV